MTADLTQSRTGPLSLMVQSKRDLSVDLWQAARVTPFSQLAHAGGRPDDAGPTATGMADDSSVAAWSLNGLREGAMNTCFLACQRGVPC